MKMVEPPAERAWRYCEDSGGGGRGPRERGSGPRVSAVEDKGKHTAHGIFKCIRMCAVPGCHRYLFVAVDPPRVVNLYWHVIGQNEPIRRIGGQILLARSAKAPLAHASYSTSRQGSRPRGCPRFGLQYNGFVTCDVIRTYPNSFAHPFKAFLAPMHSTI